MSTQTTRVGPAELAALKLLALDGATEGGTKISCADLASRLDASNQTASRRLQALDDADHVDREVVVDGQWVTVTDRGRRALEREYEDYRRIFESDAGIALTGTVTSGMGEGRHYISLSGYMEQFVARLGYEPFPGTLNLELDDRSERRRTRMEEGDAVPIDGWEDEERTYGPATCYPVTVENADGETFTPAHAIVPERTHHDEDNLELIAPEKLREALGLDDGDTIEIHVGDE